jgi:hypothetical protein
MSPVCAGVLCPTFRMNRALPRPTRRVFPCFGRGTLHSHPSPCPCSTLHVIPQHEFFGVRMEVRLLVHPVGHRIAAQVMLEPVRSYVSGTISGTSPCR